MATQGGDAAPGAAPRRLFPPELVSGGVDLPGRLVLNVWRVLRSEAKLPTSSAQTAARELLGETLPLIPPEAMAVWWRAGGAQGQLQALRHLLRLCECNFRFLDALNVLPRAVEAARMLGIDVFSVLSRGSQYRVEGMLMRAAHRERMLLMSPSKVQVASQRGAECIPMVMEPKSAFYFDPVLVLDFQSLYPSIVIAYNLCYSTCLGKLQAGRLLGGVVCPIGGSLEVGGRASVVDRGIRRIVRPARFLSIAAYTAQRTPRRVAQRTSP